MDISLSLNEKIGQRFMMGINNENIHEIIKLIKENYLGGVVLYKKNYHNYIEMLDVIKKLKEANKNNKIPLFIAIDQEGGKVNRLPDEIHNLKNIYDISKCDSDLVFDYANIIGRILRDSGINMNLAPVLDIDNGTTAKSLYKRCFYGNQDDVSKGAIKYLDGLNKMIIPVIKHYPGHGLTTKDTHFMVPYITNLSELDKHLKPFNECMNNIDALMIGHLVIKRESHLLPASISNSFISKLREKYDGLIITDEINMLKRNPIYHFNYQNKALKAGSDIILVKIKDARDGYKIIDKYKKILMNNKEYYEKLNNSVKRIIRVKEKYEISDSTRFLGIDITKINDEIDKLNERVTLL
jgi:beta-N-acetylhexosaminidase